jgi:hypothetical protein
MNCTELSDRMPTVALGHAVWSAEEKRHLEDCADCAAEWRVVRLAQGVTAARPDELDADRIAGRVLQRLAIEPAATNRSARWWYGGVGVAAAALLLVIALRRDRGDATAVTDFAPAGAMPVMGLDSLNEEQLRMVLESLDEPLETPTNPLMPSMLDLDDQQLERVIRSLGG